MNAAYAACNTVSAAVATVATTIRKRYISFFEPTSIFDVSYLVILVCRSFSMIGISQTPLQGNLYEWYLLCPSTDKVSNHMAKHNFLQSCCGNFTTE